eukprot:4413379-Amphidinium_carterae.1
MQAQPPVVETALVLVSSLGRFYQECGSPIAQALWAEFYEWLEVVHASHAPLGNALLSPEMT